MPKFVATNSLKSVLFWSVISAAFIGPGTVTTCAMSGATYQLDLLWALTFATLSCIILQETVARITIASGYNLGEVIALRYGSFAKYLVGLSVVFGCAAYQAGNILGAVEGISLLVSIDKQILTVIIVLFCSLILLWGNHQSVPKFMGLLVVVMGFVFILVAVQLSFSVSQIFEAVFLPTFPNHSGLLIIGLVGTTIVPYNLFLGSGISKGQEIKEMRIGIILAVLIGGLISMAILVGATIVKEEFSYQTMLHALNRQLGSWAGICFAIGLFSAGFTSSITAPLAANVSMDSIFGSHQANWKKYLKWTWVVVMLVGFVFGISGIKPIPVIIVAQALNGLLLPLVTIFVMLIINDKKIIPEQYQNSFAGNLILLFVVGVTTFLGLNNIQKAILTMLNLTFSPEMIIVVMGSLAVMIMIIVGLFTLKK
ncbi:MAG: divalent metal cation transporter [Thermoflexibacter sp.]|jgi:Mn2+/Fe2+ NRAMP family transporter|nr:divalent metal cation transporter [Thermoflexibacter sp.]